MATPNNSTHDTNISQMERLTTCPVCLEKFRTPKLLPCMHTFCLTPCLTNLVDPRARSLRCPECRREHHVPAAGVQAFPMNLTMIGFLDLQPSMPSNQLDRCSLCQEQKQTLNKCHDCSKTICSDCREAHLRDATNHVHSLISQLRRTLPKLSEKIASYEQRVNLVRVNHEQIQREISTAIANLMEELKHREKALFTEAEVYMQSQLRTFRLQQEAAEVELASVASFCESFETSLANGPILNDVELANLRQQCNRYTQQTTTLQAQMPTDVQKLRFSSDNQSTLLPIIQEFGRLIDVTRDQQQPPPMASRSQSPPPPPSVPMNSFERRQPAAHYVSTIPTTMHNPTPAYNDYFQRLEDIYHGRSSRPPPASAENFGRHRRYDNFTSSMDNPFVDLSFTPSNRTTATSSYRGSWETQTPRRTSSLFGPNPFTSSAAATSRSSNTGTRPIVGGRGGGGDESTRERNRPAETIPPIQEQEPAVVERQRSNTFILDEPSLPNLPQSGAQRPRDPVNVQELYNVRPRDRAQASVAFTIDMNEGTTANAETTTPATTTTVQ